MPRPHLRFTSLCLISLFLLSICALASCAARPATATRADQQSQRGTLGAELVADSATALKELRAATRQHILDHALADACGVIVLPGVYQAGFYYSVHGGSGVIVSRTKNGGWGAPAFVGVGGAGLGMQIGLEKQRLVLVVQDQEMLESILEGGLNFDVIAKYDVLSVREETGQGSLTAHRPVLAFSDGVGLMVGVAMRGAVLTLNEGLTKAYYGQGQGQDLGDAKAVMQGVNAPGIEVFELWGALGVDPPKDRGSKAQ
ncbi:MAG: lipid-binding SYLF domain-containing protein [Proteobacteria bacterium]|nr:lipid-binding SYLF domain-containing protein [Pseudomonadota bacterium]